MRVEKQARKMIAKTALHRKAEPQIGEKVRLTLRFVDKDVRRHVLRKSSLPQFTESVYTVTGRDKRGYRIDSGSGDKVFMVPSLADLKVVPADTVQPGKKKKPTVLPSRHKKPAVTALAERHLSKSRRIRRPSKVFQ